MFKERLTLGNIPRPDLELASRNISTDIANRPRSELLLWPLNQLNAVTGRIDREAEDGAAISERAWIAGHRSTGGLDRAATVAAMSFTERITCAIGSFTSSESR